MYSSRTHRLLPRAALLISFMIFTGFKYAHSQQEYFRGMVQIFGNEEGAGFVTSAQWTAVTKTLYTYMDETGGMFRPRIDGTVREYYLVIRKADDVNDCGTGPAFRFWYPSIGKGGHEFLSDRDWGSIHAGNVKWYKVPTNMDQVIAIRNRDGVGGTYQDFYFRLDAKLPASCPDRTFRIFSIYIAAVDKVGGTSATINLNSDPEAAGFARYTMGSISGTITEYQGKIGIGTHNPVSELAVNGTITAKKIKVTGTGWADFVFKENYPLRPLEEVEQFIKTNQHLPDVPSEKEILEKGNDLGEMDKKLLQKIEELTLYLIELKKENIEIKKQLKELKSK